MVGGGFSSDKLVFGFDSYPSNDTTWSVFLGNLDDSGAANVSLYATASGSGADRTTGPPGGPVLNGHGDSYVPFTLLRL